MRSKLRCEEYSGRAVRAADDADGGGLRAGKAEQDSEEEGDEHAHLSRSTKKKALGVCQQRAEVGHRADAEEYERGIDAGLDADIEEVQQTGVCHDMAVAVVIGACLVEKCRPQFGVVKGVFAHADKVAEVRK